MKKYTLMTVRENWNTFDEFWHGEYDLNAIERETGLSIKTIRKYLTEGIAAGRYTKRWFYVGGKGQKNNAMGDRRSRYLYSKQTKK